MILKVLPTKTFCDFFQLSPDHVQGGGSQPGFWGRAPQDGARWDLLGFSGGLILSAGQGLIWRPPGKALLEKLHHSRLSQALHPTPGTPLAIRATLIVPFQHIRGWISPG